MAKIKLLSMKDLAKATGIRVRRTLPLVRSDELPKKRMQSAANEKVERSNAHG